VSPPPLIVIFGAALTPDGRPSPSLLRRIAYGLAAARAHPDAPILCSGGAGRVGPSEAAVMAEALTAAGVAANRLILDDVSLSTRENVEAAVRQLRLGGHTGVVACSDAYHLPRITLLLRLAGVSDVAGPELRGTVGAPLGFRLGMTLREALAIVHNLAVVLVRGRAS
jgi:uncharacterized SAM-binding protein YcdF (DUF218 family)